MIYRMRLHRRHACFLIAVYLASVPATPAQQQNSPHIGYVYPAGGQQGTTLQVVVGGQHLNGVTNAYISGAGVQARVIEFSKPLSSKEATELKQQLQQLQKKRAAAKSSGNTEGPRGSQIASNTTPQVTWSAADQKLAAEIWMKLADLQRRRANPALGQRVTVQITVAATAPPGERELRLETQLGLSNPLMFCVGEFTEFRRAESAGDTKRNSRRNAIEAAAPTETIITVPATVNGQILPGGVDRFRFTACQGHHLVVAVSARRLIPYLADAVPGWFQAAVSLYDDEGHELAFADHYRFQPDPVLSYDIPKTGNYTMEIRDSLYRGREDFVYRVTMGELAYVTSVFPLGGRAGALTVTETSGWNLTMSNTTVDARGRVPGVYPYYLGKHDMFFNRFLFAVDSLPEVFEKEPNDRPENSQPVSLPILVNGRINGPGDLDAFRFEGRAGQQIVAEVQARRLNSPLDSTLKLTDAAGKQLAANDDFDDQSAGLETQHADSYLHVTLPATGAYYLSLSDAEEQGGSEYAYRLRISQPRPDFDLRVVPSSIHVRAGGSASISVYPIRRDGFTGAIALALKDPPPGFSLSGGNVPANQTNEVKLTISAPSTRVLEPVNLSLQGRAMIQGREVIHWATPADDMMQAFAYHHLVPAQELKVAMGGGRLSPLAEVRLLGETPLKIRAGGTARVELATPAKPLFDKIQFELNSPPDGLSIKSVSPTPRGREIVLQSDAAKMRPGLKANLIINASAERTVPSAQGTTQGNQRRTSLGSLPAIPFEVVP